MTDPAEQDLDPDILLADIATIEGKRPQRLIGRNRAEAITGEHVWLSELSRQTKEPAG